MWATDRHEVRSACRPGGRLFAACAPAPGRLPEPTAWTSLRPLARAGADARTRRLRRREPPGRNGQCRNGRCRSWSDARADALPRAAAQRTRPDMTPAAATPATVPARATAAPAATARPRGPGRRQRFLRGSRPGLVGWAAALRAHLGLRSSREVRERPAASQSVHWLIRPIRELPAGRARAGARSLAGVAALSRGALTSALHPSGSDMLGGHRLVAVRRELAGTPHPDQLSALPEQAFHAHPDHRRARTVRPDRR